MHPELLTPGTRVVNQFLLGAALTGDLALGPPIKALMVYNSNPVVVAPDQEGSARVCRARTSSRSSASSS